MLDWNDMDPHRFERVAQMLVEAAYGATSIEGSGGDLAQDLRWQTVDGVVIFEIKSFKGTLTPNQKQKIRASLLRAVKLHRPVRWILVTRMNPRAPALAWFETLQALAPGVELRWLGQAWLDGQIAGREDLISYIEGSDAKLLRRAKQHDVERSALVSGDDLIARVAALDALGDQISPYWRWDVSSTGKGIIRTLRPRRGDAADVDPISIKPTFTFPRSDPEALELFESLKKFMEVGGERIRIPDRFIENVAVDTVSDATARLIGDRSQAPQSFEIVGLPDTTGLPLAVTVTRAQNDAYVGPPLEATLTKRYAGTGGATLTGTDGNSLVDLRLVLSRRPEDFEGQITLTLRPIAGRMPHEVVPVASWLAAHDPALDLVLRVGPAQVARFKSPPAVPAGFKAALQLAEAFTVLQDHLGRLVRIPDPLPDSGQLRKILSVARALRGEAVEQSYDGLDATVKPGMLADFLAAVPQSPGALYVTEDVELQLGAEVLTVRGLALWAPGVVLANRAELESVSIDVQPHTARFEAIGASRVLLIKAPDQPDPRWRWIPSVGP